VKQASANMEASFERARQAWTGLRLDADRFASRAVAIGITEPDLAARSEEIYLAFACAEGDAEAHRLFEERFLSEVPGYVARFRLAPHLLDEVRQRVRVKQLCGERPGIGRYRGSGPLGAWVRATAVRVALDVVAQAGQPLAADLDQNVGDVWKAFDGSPEAQLLKETCREKLTAVLRDSLVALEPRDKTLLRLHVIDGLSIDVIGRIYRIHRATVARRLAAIRARVFSDLRGRAALAWDATSADLRSMMRIMGDEIRLSIGTLLLEE